MDRIRAVETAKERTEASTRRVLASACRPDVYVFGLSFWNATYAEVREWWEEVLLGDERPGLVLGFANANTLNHAATNPAFLKALEAVDVRVNDGLGFRIASRMRGVEPRANLNGSDLIPSLLKHSERPVSVFVYGATEESNAGAAAALGRFPNVRIAGRMHGYHEPAEAENAIRSAQPDVVLVALGHPHQETFCVERCRRLGAKIVVPVGGLIDFLSGMKPRAPSGLRRRGLEWLYRFAIEPRRMFVRYMLGNPAFILRSLGCAARDRALLRDTPK